MLTIAARARRHGLSGLGNGTANEERRTQRRLWNWIALIAALAAFGTNTGASAQVQVKPWFLIVVDTSGSMQDNCTNGATNWPTCTTGCPAPGCASTANSCGLSHTRINDAKCALKNILNSTGDAEFALMQFRHPCRTDCASQNGGDKASTCDADMLLGISTSNYPPLTWVDGTCAGTCAAGGKGQELYAYGYTPIGRSLVRAKEYFTNASSAPLSPTATDAYAGCRPVAVIMLTDGDDNCDLETPVAGATSLRTSIVPTPSGNRTIDIKTYAVGFGINQGNANIEALANAGGTDAPGTYKGFYAQNEEALSAALNQIITNSQLSERCDGRDNDCDGLIDEDNPKFCDVRGIRTSNPMVLNASNQLVSQNTVDPRVPACSGSTCPAVNGKAGNASCAAPEWSLSSTCSPANILCTSPGEICNTLDDDCDGQIDEGAPRIADSFEICGDNLDNDCDGSIDEGCNGCIAQPEVCDGLDNDCDGLKDENLTQGCGSTVGRCTLGTQTCTNGVWGTCSGVNPTTETCNNIDDDCDGVVDGMTRPCGSSTVGLCRQGVQTCTAGAYGACVGNVEPASEICDNQDNDCNPATADGSNDSRVGQSCGNNRGVCTPGTTICTAGEIKCSGGTSGSAELCDGLDNDCDGNVDEGVAATDSRINVACVILSNGQVSTGPVMVKGQCRTGTSVCSNGAVACPGYVGPTAELCDNLDQDCDGNNNNGVTITDPRVGQSCGTSLGECDPGQLLCNNGALVCNAAGPGTETCNGKDDDCDGLTDENLPASPTACGNPAKGLCKPGLQACIGGQTVCQGEITPTPEICDGKDNNCDGNIDEGNPGGGKVCGTDTGECGAGTTVCSSGVLSCQGETLPSMEICDGLDNDCDGVVDNGNPGGGGRCDYDKSGNTNVTGTCRTRLDPTNAGQPLSEACGECRFGTEVCQSGKIECIGAKGPKPEVCDGLDNDCDSPCVLDNSDPAHPVLKCPDDPCKLDPSDPKYLDCAGNIDEDVATTDPNVGVICSGGSGECRQGTSQCLGGVLTCVGGQIPVDELCNGKDDDCDTVVDEGFMLGSPCGSSVGECEQGHFVCDPATGKSMCQGERKPQTETCDGLDNDCDGVIDNGNPGGGAQCGSSVGECRPGMLLCTGGQLVCSGEKARTAEACDCLDNDCDGEIDENPGANTPICAGDAKCVMCQCAQECRDAGEFAQSCPSGKVALTVNGECRCVGERCKPSTCAAQTLKQNDEVVCAPDSSTIGACVCKDNECASLCSGVVCTGDLVCDAKDGLCKEKSCLLPQFACAKGEVCNVVTKGCEPDACASMECPSDQGCRDGQCILSCGRVNCASDEMCKAGACVKDLCDGVNCAGLQVCNPANGECVAAGTCLSFACAPGFVCDGVSGECSADPCVRTTCPKSQVCREGECQLRCAPPLLDCDGTCVNPQSSRKFCGATNDCSGDNAGKTCGSKQVCSDGMCSDRCQAGYLACDGGCIDPLSDEQHCGASGDCSASRAGVACGAGYHCQAGECLQETKPDAGTSSEQPKRRVSVNGGPASCACNLAPRPQSSDLRLVLVFGAFLLVGFRRRVRRAFARSLPQNAAWLRMLVVVSLAMFGAGCKVSTFCLDCADEDGSGGRSGRGGFAGVDNPDGSMSGTGGAGGQSGEGGEGGELPDASVLPDASADAGPVECQALEVCNGKDDDCDGNIDEGTDPLSEGIDIDSDVNNCGACGKRCNLSNAFSKCVSGKCAIDACDPEFMDFDEQDGNGCEYRCRKTASDDSLCNQRDDDCDQKVDEDIDFKTDLNNCGSCNNACKPINASGGVCDDGTCKLDPSMCNAGFVDVDGVYANGCEYQCTKAPGGVELCNGVDDDCDKLIDEGVEGSDSRLGVACGDDTGECTAGTTICSNGGTISCSNSQGPSTEKCNGKDDDCDGQTDESFPQLGLPCGNDLGECVRGNQQCISGALVCVGATTGSSEQCNGKDDDCDGKVDETDPVTGPPANVGKACVSAAGGSLTLDPSPAVGECRHGVATCMSGSLRCVGEVGPRAELCDDKDQDCDGNNVNGVAATDPMIGAPCGIDLGECSFGSYICNANQQRECLNGKLPVAEICNGKDDDCDGSYDETDDVTGAQPVGAGEPCRITGAGAVDHSAGVSVVGECKLGTTVCSGGSIGCPDYVGPKPELCDNKDQDCDGVLNNGVASTDARLGQACAGNSDVGSCEAGTTYCNAGAVACQGQVGPAAELCDGLDNDCDGTTSDDGTNQPGRGAACGTDTGACVAGTMQCAGGSMVCQGQVTPVTEACDSQDNDCDGQVDEDFQLQTNVNRCGSCSNVCTFAHATPKCVAGACAIASCDANYHDDPNTAGPDCNIGPCVKSGAEICNGKDDNCNGSVDEGLTAPTGVCNVVGACAGAVATCQGASGWVCNKLPVAEKCNGVDDNCNGQNNEGFPVGTSCSVPGQVGGCATRGTLQCNAGGTGTFCADSNGAAVVAGTPKQEVCNGVDDDCDGTVDEPCPSTDGNCVTDAWVSLGGGVDVYKYEASRPDATNLSSGANNARACSTDNKQPWTNLTYDAAWAACRAADPNARLCTEGEWEQACMNDAGGTCDWAFPGHPACNTYSSTQCNGVDYDSNPGIQASGHSGASNSCYRGSSGTPASQIFELSGNVKEYVVQRGTGGLPVRGGATNNTKDGLRCDFDFSVWPDNSPFNNVGFRCCRSAAKISVCGTYSASGLSATNSTLATTSLDVPALKGKITDVNVVGFKGNHARMSHVDYMELVGPDNTTMVTLFGTKPVPPATGVANPNCDDSDDNWSFSFDSASSTTLPAFTGSTVNPCGGGNTYAPAQTLNAYNGKSAGGTWTVRVHDRSTGSDNPTITAWGLQICVDPY